MTTLTLNKGALAHFGDSAKVRVQIRDGVVRLRPTARKSGVNLPRGEKLLELARKGDTGRITVEGVEGISAGNLALAADKYGWMALAGTAGRGEPAVKVA